LADWSFGAGRMPTSAGGLLLKQVLTDAGATNAEEYATHSCKATLLSWAAKAGLTVEARRLLGGHAAPGDRSVLQYSRDGLAGPLLELATLLDKVRGGAFQPDLTRSGRWKPHAPGEGSSSGTSGSSDEGASPDEVSSDEGQNESTAEPPEHGVWVSVRGKVHRAVSRDRSVACCGFVFAFGTAKWEENFLNYSARDLCKRKGCFKEPVIE